MSDLIIASTTDTQEQVNAAAGIEMPEQETQETEEPVAPPSEALETEPETEPAPDTGATEKKPGKGRFSKRIDELTRERYEAQAEAARLREQLENLQRQAKPEPTKLAAPEGKPQRNAYTSDEDWVEALTAWKARSLIEEDRRVEAERTRQERERQTYTTYVEKADQFLDEHPDFNQVVAGIRVSEDIAGGVQAAIVGRPNGPEVAYYLGTHPELCQELSEMTAADAVAEIGAISLSLMPVQRKSSPQPAAPIPAPLEPVGGSTRVARGLSELDPDAYIAARREQMRSRRRR